ncbi:MAG: tetratricopeptide repeat protein [Desulfatibacillaceae bacterium]
MKTTGLLALAACIFWTCVIPSPAGAIYGWFEDGQDKLMRGRYEEAVESFTRAIGINPDLAVAYYNRAIAYRRLGDFEKAVADYTEAIEMESGFADAFNNRAAIRLYQGRFAEAMSDSLRAVAADPGHVWAHNQLAWLYAACPENRYRDGEKALRHANKALELLGHEDSSLLDTKAAALAELGRFGEAVKTQKRAIDLLKEKDREARTEEFGLRLTLYESGKPLRIAGGGMSSPDASKARGNLSRGDATRGGGTASGRESGADTAPAASRVDKKTLVPEGEREATGPVEAPAATETRAQRPYSLQVGAFLNENYADERLRKLKARGYQAWEVRNSDGGKTWHIVYVGAFENMTQAEAAAGEFTSREGMPAIVRRLRQ